jgi:general secretion pathway protein N
MGRALARWGWLGALAGVLLALLVWPPAAWLARAVANATGERLLLADARGTVWRGSAVVVLSGGADSRSASALPGRLHWSLGLDGAALQVRARHACCIADELRLRVVPGLSRASLELQPSPGGGAVGHWPAAWLVGLGTPWNTLQPSGTLHLHTSGLTLEQVQGRWNVSGQAQLELAAFGSAVSTLDVLGSYRLALDGGGGGQAPARITLSTISGALLLSGSGSMLGAGPGSGLRFTGQASAAPGSEAALANLLNIMGRRQGAVSIIAIG